MNSYSLNIVKKVSLIDNDFGLSEPFDTQKLPVIAPENMFPERMSVHVPVLKSDPRAGFHK